MKAGVDTSPVFTQGQGKDALQCTEIDMKMCVRVCESLRVSVNVYGFCKVNQKKEEVELIVSTQNTSTILGTLKIIRHRAPGATAC